MKQHPNTEGETTWYGVVNQDKQTVYTTSDGQKFFDAEEAKKHQRSINLRKFSERYGYSGMDSECMATILEERVAELKAIL